VHAVTDIEWLQSMVHVILHIPEHVWSVWYRSLLDFLRVSLSRFVVRAISNRFWDSFNYLYYFWYRHLFEFPTYFITLAGWLYFEILLVSFLITFISPEMALSVRHFFFVITDYDVLSFPAWFCQFSIVASIIWLPYSHGLFLLILFDAHSSVGYLNLLIFPLCVVECICVIPIRWVSTKFCFSVE
jgi:hypothetical protein